MATTERQNRLLVAEDWRKIYQSFQQADFKSYDFETLRRTMVAYLQENYPDDFNDFIESSEYVALIDLIAYIAQALSFRVDLNARENFLATAERRNSVLRLARLINYNAKRNRPATGLLKMDSISTTEDVRDSTGANLSNSTILNGQQLSDEYDLDSVNDFALWKSHKNNDGKVAWDSPWGKGRPGWHIECSAMSTKFLGAHFDIHCGGVDNKFPHHENELAQSSCSLNTPFVNYWLHSEFLTVEGKKMSKSLNNFYVISDLVREGFTYEDFRFIVLSAHYRSKVNFSIKRKDEAKSAIRRIEEIRQRLLDISNEVSNALPDAVNDFNESLMDDLDTPKALAIFFNWVRLTNQNIDQKNISENEAKAGNAFIEYFNSIFAILDSPNVLPDEIKSLVDSREDYRKNKEWKKSDSIREKLLSLGWKLKDTKSGTKVTKI